MRRRCHLDEAQQAEEPHDLEARVDDARGGEDGEAKREHHLVRARVWGLGLGFRVRAMCLD